MSMLRRWIIDQLIWRVYVIPNKIESLLAGFSTHIGRPWAKTFKINIVS